MQAIGARNARHRGTIIGTIAAAHCALSVALFFLTMAGSLSRFDGAGPSNLTASLLNGAFEILSFPLLMSVLLLKIANTGVWGWLAFVANSLLWGWAGWWATRLWRSRHDGPVFVRRNFWGS